MFNFKRVWVEDFCYTHQKKAGLSWRKSYAMHFIYHLGFSFIYIQSDEGCELPEKQERKQIWKRDLVGQCLMHFPIM